MTLVLLQTLDPSLQSPHVNFPHSQSTKINNDKIFTLCRWYHLFYNYQSKIDQSFISFFTSFTFLIFCTEWILALSGCFLVVWSVGSIILTNLFGICTIFAFFRATTLQVLSPFITKPLVNTGTSIFVSSIIQFSPF